MTTIYPRFLGVDGSGDFVWELASGRWTWGDDPLAVTRRNRDFEPARYIEKYGRPIGLDEKIDRKMEADEDPEETAALYQRETARADGVQVRMNGAVDALAAMKRAAEGWVEGAAENDEALNRLNCKPSGQQQFVLADILRMIDDAAREVGVTPVYSDLSKNP